MAKNALQAQLLKAGLVNDKKAKQINKQTQHAKRTGEQSDQEIKRALIEAQSKKLEKDQQLNHLKQQEIEDKTLRANITQMIKQHRIAETSGDITYQFIDQDKIKKIYVNQKFYDYIVAGQIAIARLPDSYALLPRPLADRINQKLEGFIAVANDHQHTQVIDDDPYAAYVIPDDLMW